MSGVKQFTAADRRFDAFGDDLANATISRLLGTGLGTSMGAGDLTCDGTPGDVLWVPAHTPLGDEGQGAAAFYALSPVDWQESAAHV